MQKHACTRPERVPRTTAVNANPQQQPATLPRWSELAFTTPLLPRLQMSHQQQTHDAHSEMGWATVHAENDAVAHDDDLAATLIFLATATVLYMSWAFYRSLTLDPTFENRRILKRLCGAAVTLVVICLLGYVTAAEAIGLPPDYKLAVLLLAAGFGAILDYLGFWYYLVKSEPRYRTLMHFQGTPLGGTPLELMAPFLTH